jgi:hypothetical protein
VVAPSPQDVPATPLAACTPLDAVAAAAAEQLLLPLVATLVPDGATAVGPLVAGQCLPDEAVAAQIPVRTGRCYTVLGLGLAPVERVALEIGDPPVAHSESAGPQAVIGARPACFPWSGADATVRVTARATSGQGVAVARVYESTAP